MLQLEELQIHEVSSSGVVVGESFCGKSESVVNVQITTVRQLISARQIKKIETNKFSENENVPVSDKIQLGVIRRINDGQQVW